MYFRTRGRIILRQRWYCKRVCYEVHRSSTSADSQTPLHVGKSRW